MDIRRVCVYCSSSKKVNARYLQAAEKLGRFLAQNNITIVYGGGSIGSMGKLADGALAEGGKVIGIIPQFMCELEWNHQRLTELKIVDSLQQRKWLMIQNVDAVIALPGGSGTLDELLEAISLKRLGIYLNPIVIVNIDGFYKPLLELLENIIREKFMAAQHRNLWTVVTQPEAALPAIRNAPAWNVEARRFAAVR